MENRNCSDCIYSTEYGCRSWNCNYISIHEAEEAVKKMRETEKNKEK